MLSWRARQLLAATTPARIAVKMLSSGGSAEVAVVQSRKDGYLR
jgi:hypothetical protein